MYLMRELTGLSLIKIGEYFNRDHTTALHGIKKIEALMPARGSTYRQVQELTKKVRARSRRLLTGSRILGISRCVRCGFAGTMHATPTGMHDVPPCVHSAPVSFVPATLGRRRPFHVSTRTTSTV